MSEAAVHVKIEERHGGPRIARVTVDNQRRLNCLSTPLIVAAGARLRAAGAATRRCAPWC